MLLFSFGHRTFHIETRKSEGKQRKQRGRLREACGGAVVLFLCEIRNLFFFYKTVALIYLIGAFVWNRHSICLIYGNQSILPRKRPKVTVRSAGLFIQACRCTCTSAVGGKVQPLDSGGQWRTESDSVLLHRFAPSAASPPAESFSDMEHVRLILLTRLDYVYFTILLWFLLPPPWMDRPYSCHSCRLRGEKQSLFWKLTGFSMLFLCLPQTSMQLIARSLTSFRRKIWLCRLFFVTCLESPTLFRNITNTPLVLFCSRRVSNINSFEPTYRFCACAATGGLPENREGLKAYLRIFGSPVSVDLKCKLFMFWTSQNSLPVCENKIK